jgi:hypothetical protein
LTATQRKRRIAELRDYATRNFDSILQSAEREIRQEGWIPADGEDFQSYNQPRLTRRGMVYRRPWGDFFLTLIQQAQEDYYVTEETAKSYARLALLPFDRELRGRKWRKP